MIKSWATISTICAKLTESGVIAVHVARSGPTIIAHIVSRILATIIASHATVGIEHLAARIGTAMA